MRLRSFLLAGATVAAVLFAPASAGAVTYCVGKPSCVAAGGTNRADLHAALSSAASSAGVNDRIEIGPGTYTATDPGGFFYSGGAGNNVDIVGSGRDQTTLTGPNTVDTQYTVLSISNGTANHVSDLSVVSPDSTALNLHMGLSVTGSADRVDVSERVNDPTAPNFSGIILGANTTLRDSAVTGRGASGSGAIRSDHPGVVVEDVRLRGTYYGLYMDGSATSPSAIFRRIDSQTTHTGLYANGGNATVESSVLRTTSPSGDSAGVVVFSQSNKNGAVQVANSTLIGSGTNPASDGASARTNTAGGFNAEVVLDSSIVRGFGRSLTYGGPQPGAKMTARYSDYDPATNFDRGGSPTVAQGPGNINADPLFANAAGGDYRLSAGSPAIDTANPNPLGAAAPPTPDFGGLPRPADGDDNGTSLPDMGAHEFPAKVVTPPGGETPGSGTPGTGGAGSVIDTLAPSFASLKLSARRFQVAKAATPISAAARGTKIRFTLSEFADVSFAVERKLRGRRSGRRCSTRKRTGRRCTLYKRAGTFKRSLPAGPASVAFSGRIGKKALKPGSYRLTIAGKDSAGNASAKKRTTFTILR